MKKYLLGCIACSLLVSPALAQSAQGVQGDGGATQGFGNASGGNHSDQGPGGLTARDIVGKRLVDGDGNPIGRIQKLSADRRSAVVTPSHGGPPTRVDMSGLSLGMGANTVIDESKSLAQDRDKRAAAAARSHQGTRVFSSVTVQQSAALPATIVTKATSTNRSTVAP